jgi:hypothetical protein
MYRVKGALDVILAHVARAVHLVLALAETILRTAFQTAPISSAATFASFARKLQLNSLISRSRFDRGAKKYTAVKLRVPHGNSCGSVQIA